MKIIKQKLHDRKQNRLFGYDYSQDGLYFVTFCTYGRINYFGGIHNEIMCINKLGRIVWEQWQWLAKQYPYIVLHDFVVMPNHVHGIIQIDSSRCRRGGSGPAHIARQTTHITQTPAANIAEQMNGLCVDGSYMDKNDSSIVQCEGGSRPAPTGDGEIKILPLYNIIGALKTTSSKWIRRNGFVDFKWQRSFYDHIIRDEKTFFAIQNYIQQNPAIWWRDRNNI